MLVERMVETNMQAGNLENVSIGADSLEWVNKFCSLGDITSIVQVVVQRTAEVRCAWKKFRELLPMLNSRGM